MIEAQTYISAFLVGLLGGVHCVGMCGGIISALTLGISSKDNNAASIKLFPYLLSYNLARILSYMLMGFIFGGLGAWLTDLVFINHAQMFLKILAGIFLIALGLYLANWWRGLSYIERQGNIIWKYIEPTARRFIPIKNIPQAISAGFVWGWLPCGLVYSVLIWALSSGSALNGGLLMLSFGLGTLPNLLVIGLFAATLRRFMQMQLVRIIAGLIISVFGFYQILIAVA